MLNHTRPTIIHKGGDAVYGLGMLGALVYYIQTATGFWDGVLGVFQALLWPAFLVYDLLGYIRV